MPINKNNYHWYIAILHVGTTQYTLEILNDVNIRNIAAEQNLMGMGNRYILKLKSPESPVSPVDKNTTTAVSPHRQRGGPTRTPIGPPIRIFFRILKQGGVWALEQFYLLFFLFWASLNILYNLFFSVMKIYLLHVPRM